MHAVERAVFAALTGSCGVAREQKGLLAVSGGPDSMALLRALLAVQSRLRLRLEVMHFDHGLRSESPGEAEWVRERTDAAGLPLHIRRATHLSALGHGVQAAARAWRQEELLKLRVATGAHWIATGHQRDDHLETMLLKLLRGVHLSRLRGMDWRNGAFIRPLLGIARQDLQDYLRGQRQEWLTDPSNASDKYRRNRVRNELMPLLDDLSGGALAARLETLESQSRELAAWLEAAPRPKQGGATGGPPWIDVASLRKLPALARGYALERFIQHHAPGDLAARDVELALTLLESLAGPKRDRWSLDLPQGRRLERRGARLLLRQGVSRKETVTHQIDDVRVLAPAGWRVEGGRQANGASGGVIIGNIPSGAELEVRMRRDGDRFHPPWREHPVKVKDFLRDQHIPLWERDQLPLLVRGAEVVAIYPDFVAQGHTADGGDVGSNPPGRLLLQLHRPASGY